MVDSAGYSLGTRASQTILQLVDPKMVVDGSWGAYTQRIFNQASAEVKETVTRVLRTVSGSTPADMQAFRSVEKLTTSKGDRGNYTAVVQPAVLKAGKAAGFVNPRLLLAQLDFESGNGKKLSALNNYSGIKWFAASSGPMAARIARYGATSGAAVPTRELQNGVATRVMSAFMAFPSVDAFAGYYVDYLREKYPQSVSAQNGDQFVRALKIGSQGGYATDNPALYAKAIDSNTRRYA